MKRRDFFKLVVVAPFLGVIRAERERATVSYWSNAQGGWKHYHTVYGGPGAEEFLHGWCSFERRSGYRNVSMWTDALSNEELKALSSGALPTSIRRESLVGYWPNCEATPIIPK